MHAHMHAWSQLLFFQMVVLCGTDLYDGACKRDDTVFYCTSVLDQQCISSRYSSLKCIYLAWHDILKTVWMYDKEKAVRLLKLRSS